VRRAIYRARFEPPIPGSGIPVRGGPGPSVSRASFWTRIIADAAFRFGGDIEKGFTSFLRPVGSSLPHFHSAAEAPVGAIGRTRSSTKLPAVGPTRHPTGCVVACPLRDWAEEGQMTIEAALSVAGAVLVFALLWRSHRVTSRRLSEIQCELNASRDLMSRILLTQMSQKSHSEPPLADEIPPPPSTHSTETADTPAKNNALELEMALEVAEVDELCAKLITLAPPSEAAPLLWSARPWPQRRKGH
jgi:hypothetical protein